MKTNESANDTFIFTLPNYVNPTVIFKNGWFGL